MDQYNEIQDLKYKLERALINAKRNGMLAASDLDAAYQRGLEDACVHVIGLINNMKSQALVA